MNLTQHVANEINKNKTHIPLSGVTSYHILSGSLALSNSVITAGMATTLYTGNGATQSINTGIDMATQWGNLATETFGGLVWIKSRTQVDNNVLIDSIRGVTKFVSSNLTNAEATDATLLTSFNNNGFSVGSSGATNGGSGETFVSWNFQTTHRTSGVTNHGKAYTCHYNPFTGFTMVKYEGSGLAGHEIPHHLGRKLGFYTTKNLTTAATNWKTGYINGFELYLSTANVEVAAPNGFNFNTDSMSTLGLSTENNATANQYIMYGWANSYFDEANTLIGNYEVGIYQGTGATGNKVTTRGKPAWVMIKRLDSTGTQWCLHDNVRTPNNFLTLNLSSAEIVGTYPISFVSDGFAIQNTHSDWNASGGQYLYMVVYDNDSGSGKSKYQRATDTSALNLNAVVPFANGLDNNGTKNTVLTKNETVSGLTLTQGKNYVYAKNDGTYGVSAIAPKYGKTNPLSGDFYDVLENKWYTSGDVAITESRNYLDAIVYADAGGQPTYIEQLPKIEYKDVVKANEYQGKNACTAWVNFDGTTTPPTIRDSFNVSAVIRTAAGTYDVYFKTPMDNTNYSVGGASDSTASTGQVSLGNNASVANKQKNKVKVNSIVVATGTLTNFSNIDVQIFGGKD